MPPHDPGPSGLRAWPDPPPVLRSEPTVSRLRPAALLRLAAAAPVWLVAFVLLETALLVANVATVAITTVDRETLAHNLVSHSQPLAIDAEELYRSVAAADTAADASFLAEAQSTPSIADDFAADLAKAGATLAVVAGAAPDARSRADVTVITTQLPVYAGLIGQAQANRLQDFPIGVGYLREASTTLMQQRVLPAAADLYRVATAALLRQEAALRSWPVAPLATGGAAVVVLTVVQIAVARRTHRRLNALLLAATLASVASLAWVVLAFHQQRSATERADRVGTAPMRVLAELRVTALQARGDESLALVSHGEDVTAPPSGSGPSVSRYEDAFQRAQQAIGGVQGEDGLLGQADSVATSPADRALISDIRRQVTSWRTLHGQAWVLSTGGRPDQSAAVQIFGVAPVFDRLDGDVSDGITRAQTAFNAAAAQGVDATQGLVVGGSVLAAAAVALVWGGAGRRLAEYW